MVQWSRVCVTLPVGSVPKADVTTSWEGPHNQRLILWRQRAHIGSFMPLPAATVAGRKEAR